MFSNSADVAQRPFPVRWQRSPSITAKLALLYALLTFIILLAATAGLYWAIKVSLAHDDLRFLAEKVHVLRTMLAERPDDRALLREEVDWETHVLGHASYFVQILDRRGRVLLQTPGLNQAGVNQGAFPKPAGVASEQPRTHWMRTENGRLYLLAAAFARVGQRGSDQRIVRLAVDVSHEDRVLGDFRHIAELVLIAGVLLSALLGAMVARYGLRPLASLARTVEETTALRLDQRLELASWPREFTHLAGAFNRLLAHLEEAFTRLSGYAADLAHELRTPINNLMGETEVLLARKRTLEDYRQTLTSNLEEYQRLARVVDSLLFLARAENADVGQARDHFDAGRALREVADFYRPAAEEAGVDLVCEGQATLMADRQLFRRAVSNVLDNAIRHSRRGGGVRVSLQRRPDGAVQVEVADNGSGIAADERERVFDRFFRGANSRRDSSGSGLGLAIVRSIMRLHGGDAQLTSELGQGTKVILTFPIGNKARAQPRGSRGGS